MKQLTAIYIFFFILIGYSCKKGFQGDKKTVEPPQTFMVVDTVFRTGTDRLTTRVEARWYGISVGGFIKGYEVSTDNMLTWTYTTRTDSIFLLDIPEGKDSADVNVFVRAIDNFGQKDPSPASTLYPIKNSPPTVRFIFSAPLGVPSQNPTVSFPVLRYNIQGNDPDGFAQLAGYNIFINDTNAQPIFLNSNVTAFTLIAVNNQADSSLCNVLINNNNNSVGQVGFLRLNAHNTIYIQAVDRALSKSGYVAAPQIWVKKPQPSKTLVVNAYRTNRIFVQNFYMQRMASIGITNFDTLLLTEVINNNYTQLAPDFETQQRVFALFDKIIWFSDDATFSLTIGQRSTSTFFNTGGRMFLCVGISTTFDPLSDFLNWTPINNLVNPPIGSIFRVNNNTSIPPVKPGWPTIRSSQVISSARPFEIPPQGQLFSFDTLYSGGIIEQISGQPIRPWAGVSNVIAKRYNTETKKTNFIISSIPLESFNGNNNIDTLLQKILIEELAF
ncbi:MAG: hypothetical protein ACK4K9_04180 [Bacteroidia bacterium]